MSPVSAHGPFCDAVLRAVVPPTALRRRSGLLCNLWEFVAQSTEQMRYACKIIQIKCDSFRLELIFILDRNTTIASQSTIENLSRAGKYIVLFNIYIYISRCYMYYHHTDYHNITAD